MKNKEKYFDEIVKVMMDSPRYCKFIKSITPLDCHAFPCCDDCRTAAKDWMEREYREPFKSRPFCGVKK